MKKAILHIVLTVAALWSLHQALYIASVWELQSSPAQNVQVVLRNDVEVTGALSREWSGSWTVTTNTNEVVRFKDYKMMTFQPPEDRGAHGVGLASTIAIILIGGIYFAMTIRLWSSNGRR